MATPHFDYIYNPEDWEATYTTDMLSELADEMRVRLGDIAKIATLIEGPPMFLAVKVETWDEAGDPDDYTIEWFATEAEAKAVVAAQRKLQPGRFNGYRGQGHVIAPGAVEMED